MRVPLGDRLEERLGQMQVCERIAGSAPPADATTNVAESRLCFLVAISAHLDTFHNSVGKAHVINKLRRAEIVKPERTIPTTMEFVDIAGLVAGASKGEGLGNKFLANIRETDAIVHVVRCFEDDDVVHVAGKVSPANDIEIINTELVLADLTSVEKLYEKAMKNTKSGQKDGLPLRELLEKILCKIIIICGYAKSSS